MARFAKSTLLGCALAFFVVAWAMGQSSGSRGGLGSQGPPQVPALGAGVVEKFITIESSAEVRVTPTEIRVVLAVTSEGETAQECQQAVQATINSAKADWLAMGLEDANIVVDFIALLPRFQWMVETQDGVQVGVERKVGYRMQTNVHLAVDVEETAQAAIGAAFNHGVTDIIAFDYWSSELDTIKAQARQQAVAAATAKAELLLGAMFETRPPAINLQEETDVCYPESLYESFERSDADSIGRPARAMTLISAYRPKNTYYRGLYTNGDIQSSELPMRPEISVVSTVRLYYESPAAAIARAEKAKENANAVPVGFRD